MRKALTATYDGTVLKLDESLDLKANTRVRVTIEEAEAPGETSGNFERAAGSWKDLVDCDRLIQDIYRSRTLQTRKEPRL